MRISLKCDRDNKTKREYEVLKFEMRKKSKSTINRNNNSDNGDNDCSDEAKHTHRHTERFIHTSTINSISN
jgi:hypothetical protein